MFNLHESLRKLNKGFRKLFEARPPSAADIAKAYKIFDIRPGSDLSNLNAQWKTLARKHHPDLGGSLEKMKDVNWAKDILDGIASSGSRGYSSYSYDPPKPPPRRPPPPPPPPPKPKKPKDIEYKGWVIKAHESYDSNGYKGIEYSITDAKGETFEESFDSIEEAKKHIDYAESKSKKEPKQEPKKDQHSDDVVFDISSMSEADQKKYHSLSLKILKAATADKFNLIAKLDALKAKYKTGSGSKEKAKEEPKKDSDYRHDHGKDAYKKVMNDIKGIVPGDKDIQRMKDIITKSNGNLTKMMSLVRVMAAAITDKDKAQRRAAAAFQILPFEIVDEAMMLFLSKY